MFGNGGRKPPQQPQEEPCEPIETGVEEMAKEDELVRTVTVSYSVRAGDVGVADASFKVFAGQELLYGQVIQLAITEALKEMSLKAYDIISGAGDDAPDSLKVEAMIGKAVL